MKLEEKNRLSDIFKPVVLNWNDFAVSSSPPPIFGRAFDLPRQEELLLQASGVSREPRMLLKTVRHPTLKEITGPQITVVLLLRN